MSETGLAGGQAGDVQDGRTAIGRALGKVPSGVFILTASHDGRSSAMMASWVQQAGFEPPAVSIALAKDRSARGLIEVGLTFALSVLGKEGTSLMKKYARGIAPTDDPFAGVATTTTPGGQVVLCNALAWLECRVMTVCDFGGDHDVLIAKVVAGALLGDGLAFTHIRGNGFHY